MGRAPKRDGALGEIPRAKTSESSDRRTHEHASRPIVCALTLSHHGGMRAQTITRLCKVELLEPRYTRAMQYLASEPIAQQVSMGTDLLTIAVVIGLAFLMGLAVASK